MSPNREMIWLPNICRMPAIDVLEVWAVTLSCWNHGLSRSGRFSNHCVVFQLFVEVQCCCLFSYRTSWAIFKQRPNYFNFLRSLLSLSWWFLFESWTHFLKMINLSFDCLAWRNTTMMSQIVMASKFLASGSQTVVIFVIRHHGKSVLWINSLILDY